MNLNRPSPWRAGLASVRAMSSKTRAAMAQEAKAV